MPLPRNKPRGPWTSRFDTTDPQEACAYLRRVYGENTIRVTGDPAAFHMTHLELGAGPLSSATLTQTAEVEHRTPPLGRLVVGRVLSGHVERDTAGEPLRAGSGDVLLVVTPDRPCVLRTKNVEVQLVQIDPAVLADMTASTRDGPAVFTGYRPVSAAAARLCAGLLECLARDVLANDEAAKSPLLVDSAARLLGATLLTTFPNTASHPHDLTTSAPATLRHALAFIQEHAHEPISLTRIAAATHVTARTLQLTFRQELGITPTEYLRRFRLDRAHHDLLAVDPADGVSVTAIARRWGFRHAGRFAARYRQVYGRSPRETLRSRESRRR